MKVSDYLRQQGAANVLSYLRSTPGCWPLSLAIKAPKDVQFVADALALDTMEAVNAWLAEAQGGRIARQDVWQELVAPTIGDITGLQDVAWPALDEARHLQCTSATDYQRMNSDAGYLLPNIAKLRDYAYRCPSHRYDHTNTERRDCDDHVGIARGWLGAQGVGNLAVGKAGCRMYRRGDLILGHALLLCFTREAIGQPIVAWWWEPQTGVVHPISETNLGNPSPWVWDRFDRIELAWCDF